MLDARHGQRPMLDGCRVMLRDSTLREGLDVPGVRFSREDACAIAAALARAGVPEAEVVAPSRVLADLEVARALAAAPETMPRRSGLVYATGTRFAEEVAACAREIERFDVLVPLSEKRPPAARDEKVALVGRALEAARAAVGASGTGCEVGAGFPHATQADVAFVVEIARAAERAGAQRVTVYDTNGSGDPFAVRALIEALVAALPAGFPVFFHGHDDLGLATANALAAVLGGAAGLDVTVNGLGDRAGNASLEQAVMALRARGFATGVDPATLRPLSRLVAEASGIAVWPLAPVVGELVFAHRSPGHLTALEEFEAFAPELVRARRTTA